MPCDSGPSYSDPYRAKADELAQILCELMIFLNEKALIQGLPLRARAWFEQHQKADRERNARELDGIRRKEDKEAALAKLTDYERSLLGYK